MRLLSENLNGIKHRKNFILPLGFVKFHFLRRDLLFDLNEFRLDLFHILFLGSLQSVIFGNEFAILTLRLFGFGFQLSELLQNRRYLA